MIDEDDEDGVRNYADDIDVANGDVTPRDDPNDCLDCGTCASCVERSIAYADEMATLPQDEPSEPSETELADENEALR